MSSASERLELIHAAFSKAYQRRAQDLKDANSEDQAQKVLDNVEALEIQYLRAAKQALDATGADVEQAYQAAKDAQKSVDDAYEKAKALPERIRLVSSIAQNVTKLVKAAKA